MWYPVNTIIVTSGTLSGGTRTYVPSRDNFNVKVRLRAAAWLRYKMRVRRLNIRATAELMGFSSATVSRVYGAQRMPGYDFVVALSETFAVPLEVLTYTDPPVEETEPIPEPKPRR